MAIGHASFTLSIWHSTGTFQALSISMIGQLRPQVGYYLCWPFLISLWCISTFWKTWTKRVWGDHLGVYTSEHSGEQLSPNPKDLVETLGRFEMQCAVRLEVLSPDQKGDQCYPSALPFQLFQPGEREQAELKDSFTHISKEQEQAKLAV